MDRVHDGHRTRVRERIETCGIEAMPPHEVVEYLLFYALPMRDTNELAHRLVARFGSVAGVLSASEETLAGVEGVGDKTARFLCALGQALDARGKCLRYGASFRNIRVLSTYLRAEAGARKRDLLVCFDPCGRIRRVAELLPDFTARDFASVALQNHAYSVVLVRMRLEKAARFTISETEAASACEYIASRIEIQFVDHIVVWPDGILSMRAQEREKHPLRDVETDAFVGWLDD